MDDSDQDGVILRELVKKLAECLVNSDSLRDLERELEKAHIFNGLSYDEKGDEQEELDRLASQLYDLVRGYSLLPRNLEELLPVLELPPELRGEWAYEEVISRL